MSTTAPITHRRIQGLVAPAKAWKIAAYAEKNPKILVACKDRRSAENLFEDLKFFVPGRRVLYLATWDSLPLEPVSPALPLSASRLTTLMTMSRDPEWVVVASAEALAQMVLPQNLLKSLCQKLRVGAANNRDELLKSLDRLGFKHAPVVETVGQVAVRGGVIDIFPASLTFPVRIEFLDETIEQIKPIDVSTQRSQVISPISEILLSPIIEQLPLHDLPGAPDLLESTLRNLKGRAKQIDTPPREAARILHYLKTGVRFPGIELMQLACVDGCQPAINFAPAETFLVINDSLGISQTLESFADLVQERETRIANTHTLCPTPSQVMISPQKFMATMHTFSVVDFDFLEVRLDIQSTFVDQNQRSQSHSSENVRSALNTELATRLKAQIGSGSAFLPLKQAVDSWKEKDWSIGFVVGSESRLQRLTELLFAEGIDVFPEKEDPFTWTQHRKRLRLAVFQGDLSEGFQLPNEKVVFVSEREIFANRSTRRKTKKPTNLRKILSALGQLKDNDHVVHIDYGVGIYRGLKHIAVEDSASDFLHIEYADSTLYLPVQQIGKIQRYSGPDANPPSLDKLSSNRWAKTKQKIRESVIALAGDLINLYAARSIAKGWRYEPFNAEDERFSDAFPYDETPDQMKAIEETLADMASDKPMERLVCGDVGFGKTEVAIRAAFKCVQHQRQVAVLVPTTILVEQHTRSFIERFAGYPIQIAAISRFYSPQENRETLHRLAIGELDILIGTHKILGDQVKFNDLGLIIVDEEHRFGVKQKERLKQLKTKTDVLTLTATPIPRTLHMSLLGIRDISVITTAPVDRKTVRTYVAERDTTLIHDAILRELRRGGQIFFVYNRVEGIELIAAEIRSIIPGARVTFAHGQMGEDQIEKILKRFLEREIDVLVTTTIIESGVDIPNVNTIIIDNAPMFGLAQLYQLRGRVGRSPRQAYAYLLVPKAKKLSADAQERLRALQSLDELGIGFNLALRDLEIRGSGNLLGQEQSGSVGAVGFDLYTKILQEAVLHLKGEELDVSEAIDPEVKLGINAFIPSVYIPDVSERLVLYQRLASIIEHQEADDLIEEMEDRFGPLPREVADLVETMRIRGLLRRFGVTRCEWAKGKLVLSFSTNAKVDPQKLFTLVEREPQMFKLGRNLTLTIGSPEPSQTVLAKIKGNLPVKSVSLKSVSVKSVNQTDQKSSSLSANADQQTVREKPRDPIQIYQQLSTVLTKIQSENSQPTAISHSHN